ncbi:hypothetical protein [Bradyrhizobium sp. USDA 377]
MIQLILVLALGIVIAVGIERLLNQYSKRLKEDCLRMAAARDALEQQKRLVDAVLDNDHIPYAIKSFVIDVSSLIPEQAAAMKIADWVERGGSARSVDPDAEEDAIFDSLRELNKSHPEAFEIVVSSLRAAFVTTMLQWPSTAAMLVKYAHRISSESTSEVTASAAAVQRAARSNHWMDGNNVVPA